jgi:hypothetical protein
MATRGTSGGDPDEGGLRIPTGLAPDPTPRTTQQVLRENFWLRELLETRLLGMDKALQLLQAFADRTPTTMDVQNQVQQLREVVMAKFQNVDSRFTQKERELTAAFQSQEKQAIATNSSVDRANTKMEDGFTKQLDGLRLSGSADKRALEDKIDDMKSRLTIIESKTSVSDPSTAIKLAQLDAIVARLTSGGDISRGAEAGKAALWALVVGGLGLVAGLGSMVAMFIKMLR